MNAYLRAVGFSNIDRNKMRKLIESVEKNPDKRYIVGSNHDEIYIEYYKEYGNGIGVVGKGVLDERENPFVDVCEPYICSDWDIEAKGYFLEHLDDSTAVIIFEDETSGNELAFELQSHIEYKQNEKSFTDYGSYTTELKKVNIAGLSLYATIILPVVKDSVEEEMQQLESTYYKNLVGKSRNGDEEAIELLTFYEQQTSDTIRARLEEEDFLSVVEGYILPSEDDELAYNILGDIEKVNIITNPVTGEEIYKLDVDIIGVRVQIFINKYDVTGLPIEGMRFMGCCKLQGNIVIEKNR